MPKTPYTGSWDTAVTVTTSEDIGILAEIIFAEPRIINRVIYTAGDTVTYAQLADIVESILSRKVQRVEWSVPRRRNWQKTLTITSRNTGGVRGGRGFMGS